MLNYDTIHSLAVEMFLNTVGDNVMNSSPVLARLRSRSRKEDGGHTIAAPVRFAAQNGGSYTGFSQFNIDPVETHTKALLPWRGYEVNITITGDEEDAISGDRAVVNLMKTKVEAAQNDLSDLLSAGIYNDPSTGDAGGIDGFVPMIKSGNTYAGINRAQEAWWNPGVYDTNLKELANLIDPNSPEYLPQLLRNLISGTKFANRTASLIVVTDAIFDMLTTLESDKVRYADPKLAQLAFDSIKVGSAIVVPDSHCPDYHIFSVHENALELVEHSKKNFKLSPFQKPVDRDGQVAQIFWKGNLITNESRVMGAMTNVGSA